MVTASERVATAKCVAKFGITFLKENDCYEEDRQRDLCVRQNRRHTVHSGEYIKT